MNKYHGIPIRILNYQFFICTSILLFDKKILEAVFILLTCRRTRLNFAGLNKWRKDSKDITYQTCFEFM